MYRWTIKDYFCFGFFGMLGAVCASIPVGIVLMILVVAIATA